AAGVEILTEAEVGKIQVSAGVVSGVNLSDGRAVRATKVAAACDPKQLFLELVPREDLGMHRLEKAHQIRARGAAAKLHFALKGQPKWQCRPEKSVTYLRTGASLDGLERAFDPIKYREFGDDLALDIYVPTLEDPSLAPPGHHVVSIFASFVPQELAGGW